jgi:uncharacterized repeat protein (TIGR03803 family)
MKSWVKIPLLVVGLMAALSLAPGGQARGQSLTDLHSFSAVDGPWGGETNSDGATPDGALVLSGDTLYGTTPRAGSDMRGTLFAVKIDGTEFSILHAFGSGSDGDEPGGLVLSGNILYGTTLGGGSYGQGTLFAINTDGTGYRIVHHFQDTEGPVAALTLSGNVLYGTTFNNSSVFEMNIDGSDFRNIHEFDASGDAPGPLTLSGNVLYGETGGGQFGEWHSVCH